MHRPAYEPLTPEWLEGPARPLAPGEEVHLWRAELDGGAWPGPQALPAAERERAAAMRKPGAARRWTAARWALREVLSRYLGGADPATIALRRGEHGKPELADDDGLRFNLSHSEGLALVAVATLEVGVDVERMAPRGDFLALAERALGAEAIAAIRAAAPVDREAAFYTEWSRHEALVKCLGTGLAHPVPEGQVTVESIAAAQGYAAAVAVAGGGPPSLRAFVLSPLDE